jgi:hypothetical protein
MQGWDTPQPCGGIHGQNLNPDITPSSNLGLTRAAALRAAYNRRVITVGSNLVVKLI